MDDSHGRVECPEVPRARRAGLTTFAGPVIVPGTRADLSRRRTGKRPNAATYNCSSNRKKAMTPARYRKGLNKLKELTVRNETSPTGHMEVGERFKDVAPDLTRLVVEFAFGDIYARPGVDNKQKVLTTISALGAQGTPQIGMR